MAATDQAYRNQLRLDIVFAVSSILMLLSIVWMLVDDYRREYKTEQRIFRDVEMAMAQRDALSKLPSKAAFDAAADTVAKAEEQHKLDQDTINKLSNEISAMLPEKDKKDLELSNLKASFDSKKSFYDIEVDKSGAGSDRSEAIKAEIKNLGTKIAEARNEVEDVTQKIKSLQADRDKLDKPLTAALGSLKKLLDGFDRQLSLAIKKQWTIYDDIRALPVIDGFAAPTKIEQITLRDLTIDYNFLGVTRFDRCTTCHKGIAKPAYTKENLEDLWYSESPRMAKKLEEAEKILEYRKQLLAGLDEGRSVPGEGALKLTMLSDKRLTPARISEFAAHPRLDLFVDPNSKHPVEKFGCTICHGGQPSGTSFTYAAHTPNDADTRKRWQREHDWQAQHDWDFPMQPHRFIESSCLKCHHQVTDLYSDGNKTGAPKVLKGYELIREFGCFGCHEISGFKGGRQIGPDLRLEPNPAALDSLSPAEAAKLLNDPDNPPGTFRKVGPSLRRVSEKTNEEWARKWIKAPREFRPDTKMPHYYGLSNNNADALEGTNQGSFPDTEVYGIAHYLFKTSRDYVANIAKIHDPKLGARIAELEAKSSTLTDAEKTELENAKVARASTAAPLDRKLAEIKGNVKNGRDLFSKRGCLACHSHAATNDEGDGWPAIASEADFGPNLTQLKEKLVAKDGKTDKATLWLTNWVKNPTNHSPRTRMPITHLSDQEAADVAAWLLAQNIPTDEKTGKIAVDLQGAEWARMNVIAPEYTDLKDLAKVYLDRTLAATEVVDFFDNKLEARRVKDLGADEQELDEMLRKAKGEVDARRDAMLYYVGKKAVSRLGCFGCHDIPGFDSAKPVGTALADWGKKDPSRLAFEDIANYVKKHFPDHPPNSRVVDGLVDEDGYPRSVKHGPLYERFYYSAAHARIPRGLPEPEAARAAQLRFQPHSALG